MHFSALPLSLIAVSIPLSSALRIPHDSAHPISHLGMPAGADYRGESSDVLRGHQKVGRNVKHQNARKSSKSGKRDDGASSGSGSCTRKNASSSDSSDWSHVATWVSRIILRKESCRLKLGLVVWEYVL